MCMLKQLFNSIFSKQTNQVPPKVPTFTLTDNGPVQDFELAEMNFVEFAELAQKEFAELGQAELAQKERRKTAGAFQSK